MRTLIAALVRRGPTVLAGGVGLGLLVPPLADLARPLMPVTVFLFVFGTLLRVEPSAVRAVARRPAVSLLLPAATMILCPVALGIAARLAGMPYDWVVALVIAYCAPPSSGTSTIARMLSLDASVALVATLASMVFVPLTAPLLTAWFSHDAAVSISPLNLALRLALLIGSAEGVALLVRRFAGSRLDRYATPIDATVVAALLVFALGTMAGMQQSIIDAPHRALTAIALAFAVNAGFQIIAYGLTPGDVRTRLNVALIVANRNVGLMWAALGLAATPTMALVFTCAQLPIYTLPRVVQHLLPRLEAQRLRRRAR
ncbi:hypothetical protein PPH94_035150 [Burkholderia cepacia]|uniref:hypothetical protein n=1 Tax=Burkholderia cepacia TaxID=292 RepID=UPI001CF3810E|nr:hypothetical protein [Burkholderia cepacia]MCA8330452.1 hypothetical protein [Burkholderia cepacia]MDC6098696.1 hypothetical protein [Burkholderia cepacia]